MAIELLTPFTKVELEPEIKEKKRKQVGILGGNFNPVHNAHLIVADQVRQQLGQSLNTIVSRCLSWLLRGLKD